MSTGVVVCINWMLVYGSHEAPLPIMADHSLIKGVCMERVGVELIARVVSYC